MSNSTPLSTRTVNKVLSGATGTSATPGDVAVVRRGGDGFLPFGVVEVPSATTDGGDELDDFRVLERGAAFEALVDCFDATLGSVKPRRFTALYTVGSDTPTLAATAATL